MLRGIVEDAPHGTAPTVAMAKRWHRQLYAGITLPVTYYAGQVRDSDDRYPLLVDYEILVGNRPGVPARQVPGALKQFEHQFSDAVAALDARLSLDDELDPAGAEFYVTLVAVAHGEWIRIHPFANGNGRTARLWTHWLAARYDLPPLLRVKPRPDDRRYGNASDASMDGDHRLMRAWLLDRLLQS